MRARVTWMRQTQADDGQGGFTTTWSPVATLWAEVIGINGREAVIAQALEGVSYFRIRIRWRADAPTDKDQLKFGSLDLNIRSVADPNGEREQLLILADTASTEPT